MYGRKIAITGAGISQVGRRLMRPAMDLLADAALAALADAGLERKDIDGLVSYPGYIGGGQGFSPLGVTEVHEALGLRTNWHSAGPEGPAQTSALMIASMAVASGVANHVLVFRALTESSSQATGRQAIATGSREIGGWLGWLVPSGAASAANWAAMFATRRMHEFGTTREDYAHQVLLQRANAQLNPAAVMRGKTLDMDEYMAARMISDPLCLYDCDVPVDGASVFIVSALEAAADLRKPPLQILSLGAGLYDRDSWDQKADLTSMAASDSASSLWAKTDLSPADVDVAGLYDGFSIFVPMWLEAHGFCARGEGERFIADGHTALSGSLPVNTGGGQLSAGRLHGYGHLYEVCQQLWGEAELRQVPDATVGLVSMGGGPTAGSVLIARH